MTEGLASSKAIVAFSIASGVASGLATMYLGSKFANKQVHKTSLVFAILVAVGVGIGSAFIIKEFASETPEEAEGI